MISGFHEEGYGEIMDTQEGRYPRRKQSREVESVYYLTKVDQREEEREGARHVERPVDEDSRSEKE